MNFSTHTTDVYAYAAKGTPPAGTPPPQTEEAVAQGFQGYKDIYGMLVGAITGSVLVVLICIVLVVLLWCLCRRKGSYVTNEMDDDNMDDVKGDEEESVGSDTGHQTRAPLKTREEE